MTEGPVALTEGESHMPRTYRAFVVAALLIGSGVMVATDGNLVASVGAFLCVMALPVGFIVFLNRRF